LKVINAKQLETNKLCLVEQIFQVELLHLFKFRFEIQILQGERASQAFAVQCLLEVLYSNDIFDAQLNQLYFAIEKHIGQLFDGYAHKQVEEKHVHHKHEQKCDEVICQVVVAYLVFFHLVDVACELNGKLEQIDWKERV
jgi:regulator of RNase E activity RraB